MASSAARTCWHLIIEDPLLLMFGIVVQGHLYAMVCVLALIPCQGCSEIGLYISELPQRKYITSLILYVRPWVVKYVQPGLPLKKPCSFPTILVSLTSPQARQNRRPSLPLCKPTLCHQHTYAHHQLHMAHL